MKLVELKAASVVVNRLTARSKCLFAALVFGGLAAMNLGAQLHEYEGFDYTGTTLDGQTGGTGWGANAWTDPDSDAPLSGDDTSLIFPSNVGHTPQGSRLSFAGVGEADRTLGTTLPLNVEGSTYYISMLVRRQGDFRVEFYSGGNVRWQFGAQGADQGLVGMDSTTTTSGVFPMQETVYVVCKMLTHNPNNDQVFLNVYRAAEVVPPTEPSTWQVTTNRNSGVVLSGFRIRNISDLPLDIDEIRIGTSYAEVVAAIAGGPPAFVRHPAGTTVYEGATVTLSVEAVGEEPLAYQWNKDGAILAGANDPQLVLAGITADQAGEYSVTVSNAVGVTNSDLAVVQVIAITNVLVGQQGYWRLDETNGLVAADSTANGNHGALTSFSGDDSYWVPGRVGGALQFNGANYVQVPDHASIGAGLVDGFTVATWLRSSVPLSVNEDRYRVFEKGDCIFLLQGNNGNLGSGGMNLAIKRNSGLVVASLGQALAANQWYHLAGTFDGQWLKIYLNGVLTGSNTVSGPIDDDHLPLRIGSDDLNKFFNGALDEVGIWDRPLDELEIQELAGLTGPPTILTQPVSATLYEGASGIFSVEASGKLPLRYLWYKGTNEIREASGPTFTLANAQLADAGVYRCRISNTEGELFTDEVTLTVLPVTNINVALAAQWTFEDVSAAVAADASGNGYDGQLLDYADPSSALVTGPVGNALTFDGLAHRISVTNSGALNLETEATIAFWLNPTNYGIEEVTPVFSRFNCRILRKGAHLDLRLTDDPGFVRKTLLVNGIPAQQNSVNLNEWQHFAVVFRAGTVAFYKNGFPLGDPVPGSLGAANTNALALGNYSELLTDNSFYAGAMDEVSLWNRPLNEAEILELASRDSSGAPVIVTSPSSASRFVGSTVSFLTEATGLRPVTYQWYLDGLPIADATANRLVLANLTVADAGEYTVAVANSLGTATSAPPATLTVLEVTNVAAGLVAFWPFDDTTGTNVTDASGKGHDGQLQNAESVSASAGMIGAAQDFDGLDDFIVVPHAPDLNLSDPFTVSVWVNPRTLEVEGDLSRIVRKDINVDISLYRPRASIRMYGINKTTSDAPANIVTTNEWQHLAIVHKDGAVQFFRNGQSLGAPVPYVLGGDNTSPLIIGNFGPDLSIRRLFNGFMDELGIWMRPLSAAEVDGIYQNGLLGRSLSSPFQPLQIDPSGATLSNGLLRLEFFTPYFNRQYVLQRRPSLSGSVWLDETNAVVTPIGQGLFEVSVPLADEAMSFYRIAVQPPMELFTEDFESGAIGWTHGGDGDNWELGAPINGPGLAHSGTNVFATGLNDTIQPWASCYLRSPAIDLANAPRATLSFFEWRNVDPDPQYQSTVVSLLDATTLAPLEILSTEPGATSGYQERVIQIPPQYLDRRVIIEFLFYGDDTTSMFEGWYIDDVKILQQ